MNPASSSLKLTYDDYVHFPDDGQRHELIDGEHYVTPTPSLNHQRISRRLFFALASYLAASPIGEVFAAPLDVILSNVDIVEPDILYVSAGRRAETLSGQVVQGAPDLAVEIGSPSTRRRDETIKRHLYERAGVAEYWVVDPDIEAVRIYRLGPAAVGASGIGRRYGRPTELLAEAGDVLTSPLLPGLSLPLAEIFAEPRGLTAGDQR
jgi:Uma2 family endonuclease